MPLDPQWLPHPTLLKQRAKALAMLDAIVCPDWEDRYYSFNAAWTPGQAMASMRNGTGDDWFVLFGPQGVGIKGLAHELGLARDAALLAEVRKAVPATLSSFLDEPAFDWTALTYCYWNDSRSPGWHRVAHPDAARRSEEDGSEEFLALLVAPASAYVEFARWYYEIDIPPAVVEAIYAHGALSEDVLMALNPDYAIEQVRADALEIGYGAAAD